MKFTDLKLNDSILKAIEKTGYDTPTPIQEQAIPHLLEGKDLLGCAQTGTGKTAAFSLPLLQLLSSSWGRPASMQAYSLILTPTRELAIQIYENIKTYSQFLPLKISVVYGGVGIQPQIKSLNEGADILIATPGRLIDLIQQRKLTLREIKFFVLDEADRMLDMGFIHDIKKIIALLPQKRQTLLFSATMPNEIQKLAYSLLKNPIEVSVNPTSSTAEKIDQEVMYVEQSKKRDLLKFLLQKKDFKKVIVFTRTKFGANRVSEVLTKMQIPSEALHGNKSQNARQRAIENFRTGKTRVLIATDIAARGIDIDGVTHVINFEIPNISESYVHRIGRTARAGASGKAISFCDAEEKSFMRDIEKLIGKIVPLNREQPFHSDNIEKSTVISSGKAKAQIEGRQNNQSRGQSNHGSKGNEKNYSKKRKFFSGNSNKKKFFKAKPKK